MKINKENIEVGFNVDTTELKQAVDLTRKLKFELIEVNKQFEKLKKLGLTKREMKKIFKKWNKYDSN